MIANGLPFPSIGSGDLELFQLVMGLLGGLAIFLYGMEKMADALKAVAGTRMKTILSKLTTNRFTGILTGAFVTAIIQSSSVTTVLVVGFITAGLMSMTQSIGVIMGANIGTTITAQIIAFKVTKYAMLLVAVGFAMTFVGKRERTRQHGAGLLGLGMVFLGMALMGKAMEPLRAFQPFLDLMTRMENPILGILAGTIFTGLVQSSSATTGVVIVMASQGFISLETGIALSFGANIGTCVTALLASIGKPREALRAAMVHVLFNVLGVVVWLPLIGYLAAFVVSISPATDLAGTEKLAAETPRQIANAHTIFNVANTFIFVWFASVFARVVQRLVPDRPLDEEATIEAKYLDAELLSTPSLALDRARFEFLHMGERIQEMMREILPALLDGDDEALRKIRDMDDAVDILHGHIVVYLGKISRNSLTEEETQEFINLMQAANDLENIGDIIETNLVTLGHERISYGVRISDQTKAVIEEFHATVSKAIDSALQGVVQKNAQACLRVVKMKSEINRLEQMATLHQADRLVADEPNRVATYKIEIDILNNLKRIYYFCKRMARLEIPSARLSDTAD